MNRLLAIHQSNFSSNGSFDHLIVCVVFHCYSANVIFTTSRFNMNSSYSHLYGMFTLVCVMCGWATIHSTFSRFAFRRIQIDFDSLAVFVCHGSVMFYVCCSVAYIPPITATWYAKHFLHLIQFWKWEFPSIWGYFPISTTNWMKKSTHDKLL